MSKTLTYAHQYRFKKQKTPQISSLQNKWTSLGGGGGGWKGHNSTIQDKLTSFFSW